MHIPCKGLYKFWLQKEEICIVKNRQMEIWYLQSGSVHIPG